MSSDCSKEDMSVDHMTISKTGNGEDKTYQSRIENFGAITNED
jgi:hypothetical protein